MPNDEKKLTELTSSDRELVKNLGVRTLPDNPSAKGFNAAEIKAHYERPILAVHDKLAKAVKETNKALDYVYEVEATKQGILSSPNNTLNISGNTIDIKPSYMSGLLSTKADLVNGKVSTSQLPDQIANTEIITRKVSLASTNTTDQYPNAKSVWDNLKNVREVAEGKSKSFVLSYAETTIYLDMYDDYSKANGETFASADELEEYLDGYGNANASFNSQTLAVEPPSFVNLFLIFKGFKPTSVWTIVKTSELSTYIKSGDIILVLEPEVPDRWFDQPYSFYKLETSKVDLTNVAKTNQTNTFTQTQTMPSVMFGNDYLSTDSSNDLRVTINNGQQEYSFTSSNFKGEGADLGASSYKWKDLYLSGDIYINQAKGLRYKTDTVDKSILRYDASNGFIDTELVLCPSRNGTLSLGYDYRKWKDLYLSGTSTQNIVAITNSSGTFKIQGNDANDCIFFINRYNGIAGKIAHNGGFEFTKPIKIGNTTLTESTIKPMVVLTEAEYEALETKDSNTLYLIEE